MNEGDNLIATENDQLPPKLNSVIIEEDEFKLEMDRKDTLKEIPNNLGEGLSEKDLITKMKEYYVGEKQFGKYTLNKEYVENMNTETKLYHQNLRSSETPLASVLFIHGACEHSTRYMEIAKKLADNQLIVHLFDLSGYGYSSGARTMSSVKDFYENILLIMTKVQKNFPLFIFAHSMGAGLSISFLKLNPHLKIAGLVVSCPYIDLPEEAKLDKVGKFFINCIPENFDGFMLNNQIHPHILTKSSSCVKEMVGDRFLHPIVTIKFLKTMIELTRILRGYKPNDKFNYPLFLISGAMDRLTPMEPTCEYMDKLKCDDKSFYYFENGLLNSCA